MVFAAPVRYGTGFEKTVVLTRGSVMFMFFKR